MDGIRDIIKSLERDQSPDGAWNYPFETGISTDAYMIILLRSLTINDEKLLKELTERILKKQEANGAWKLYYDEDIGNVTATTEAYYALLYSGYFKKSDKQLVDAKKFILANGGLESVHMFTKIMLSITGQYQWPSFFPLPIEMMLLPTSFPVNLYHLSVFGRANLVPIMILANKKYQIRTKLSPNLSELMIHRNSHLDAHFFGRSQIREWRSFSTFLLKKINNLVGLPEQTRKLALQKAEQYMLKRIEPDGTFYSYFSSTFLMIFALLSLGYSQKDPIIKRAMNGLLSMKTTINGNTHMQYTTAKVWNTSLISYTLQEAGLSPLDPIVEKANKYLLTRQHRKFGDWVIHNPNSLPGGWGFSDVNTMNPDIDDTTAALRALSKNVINDPASQLAWDRGIRWLLSMQNDDGGWPSFERNTNHKWLNLLPIQKGEFILSDSSSADLTGRTLEFLGNFTNLDKNYPPIKQGVDWLLKNQESNGSWYGRWGICYLYGTWCAITGLKAVEVSSKHPSILKALKWLKLTQNRDGGWGESCKSDLEKKYIPLGDSTLTHTAWAVDTLLSATKQLTEEIQAGVNFLLKNINKEDWTTSYPKGQGMADGFYIHYHSYRYIYPLLALSHYQKKFISQ